MKSDIDPMWFDKYPTVERIERRKSYLDIKVKAGERIVVKRSIGDFTLNAEIRALDRLAGGGIRTPKILDRNDGGKWYVREWISGLTIQAMGNSTDLGSVLALSGRAVARIHSTTGIAMQREFYGSRGHHFVATPDCSEMVDGYLGTLAFWKQLRADDMSSQERIDIESIESQIIGQLKDLRPHDGVGARVHGDLAAGNMVYSVADKEIVFIDPHFIEYFDPAYELAYLCMSTPAIFVDERNINALLKGYGAGEAESSRDFRKRLDVYQRAIAYLNCYIFAKPHPIYVKSNPSAIKSHTMAFLKRAMGP